MNALTRRLDQLLADAEECEASAEATGDVWERATFFRMAMQYRAMAEDLKVDIAAKGLCERIERRGTTVVGRPGHWRQGGDVVEFQAG